jgi:signal transduction histidine kinase
MSAIGGSQRSLREGRRTARWARVLRALWAWALVSSLAPAASAQAPFEVSGALEGQALGLHLGVLEDPTGRLGIEDVRSPEAQFVPATHEMPGFGFTQATLWVRLTVRNASDAKVPWLLELAYPHLDVVELFIPDDAGSAYRSRLTGDSRPFSERDLRTRNFVFTLEEPAHATRTYYLRVRTTGSLNLPLRAWTVASFLEHIDSEQSVIWMFYGLMLVMAVYNLFIFFFVKQREYLHYSLSILALLLFQFTLNGHTFQYLLPNQVWAANHALPFTIGLTFVWMPLFLTEYLNLRQVQPLLYRAGLLAAWASGGLALFSLFGSYAVSIRTGVAVGTLFTVAAPVVTWHLARRGIRQARLYLLAWCMLIAGVLLYFAKSVGLLPTNFVTTWGIQIGASLEVVLLSLALADRINVMRRDLSTLNRELSANVSRLEDALARAEAATRAKSDFLATISHELRTPLNAIINIPQALAEDVPTLDTAVCGRCESIFELEAGDQVDANTACPECGHAGGLSTQKTPRYVGRPEKLLLHLGHIERSGKHLLQMVNGILDLSKLEAGKFDLSLADVDVGTLLREAVEPLAYLAQSKGVGLEISEAPEELRLYGDPVRLTQVLINLIGNAIKFSDGRGTVRVRARKEGSDCVFSVQDQGIGIAEADLERIFGSFEQVDQGDTRKYGGTGLGLAISKSLVELHGGQIGVESTLGVGSTFWFRVPVGGPPTKKRADSARILFNGSKSGTIKETGSKSPTEELSP